MPYAIKNLKNGEEPEGRLVGAEEKLEEGEILVDTHLGPGRVWDAENERVRDKNEDERTQEENKRKAREQTHENDVAVLRDKPAPEWKALVRILERGGLL
jgi:hypothetical protein